MPFFPSAELHSVQRRRRHDTAVEPDFRRFRSLARTFSGSRATVVVIRRTELTDFCWFSGPRCKFEDWFFSAPRWPARPSITVPVASCPSSCATRATAWPWTNSATATTTAATSPTSRPTVRVSRFFGQYSTVCVTRNSRCTGTEPEPRFQENGNLVEWFCPRFVRFYRHRRSVVDDNAIPCGSGSTIVHRKRCRF